MLMKTYEISPKSLSGESLSELNNAKLYSSNISNYDTFQETSKPFPCKTSISPGYTYEVSPPPRQSNQQQESTSNYYTARSALIHKEPRRRIKQPVQVDDKIKRNFRETEQPQKIVTALMQENEALTAQRDSAVNKMSQLKESNDALNQSQSDIEYQCELQTNKLNVANAHVNELKQQLDFSMKQYEDSTLHIRDLEEENSRLRKSLDKAHRHIETLESDSSALYNDNRILQQEINKRDSMISHIQNEKEDLFNELSSQLETLQKQKDSEIKGFIQDINSLESEKEALTAQVNNLNNALDTQKLANLQKDKLIPNQNEKDATNYLFNFYSTLRDMLLKQIANKEKTFANPEELRRILNTLEDKIRSLNSNMIERPGKCFACDIACCCSSNERRKFLLNKNNFKK